MKTLKKTLVKANLKEKFIKGKVNEKVLYLDLPTDTTSYSLSEDIKKGAVHFNEIKRLCEKAQLSRMIAISSDTMEMGLMAIQYLAMHCNSSYDEVFEAPFDFDGGEKGNWEESATKLPVVALSKVSGYLRSDEETFESGGFMVMRASAKNDYQPFWTACTREPICLVVERKCIDNGSVEAIKYFSKNRKVYLLFLDADDTKTMDFELPFGVMDQAQFEALKKNLILSYAMDEAKVSFGKENSTSYYKNVLRRNLQFRGIRVKRGFSYDRVVHLAGEVNKNCMCEMIDKIIDYALKDLDLKREIRLGNRDFDFIDHFTREGADSGRGCDGKLLMEDELFGLEEIKQQVYDIVNVMKYNQIRKNMNISGSKFHNVHVMLGAPGTAKTTVAKFMGQMMFDEKLLPDNRFVCINGAELKGMYVGHSAPKTKALFEHFDVIIIDEAYSIVESDGATDSFGNEAIAQLIIELEKHSTDKLVIFAGYGGEDIDERDNKMQAFLDANPGIKSRITSTFYFKSYSAEEMTGIFNRIAKNCNYDLQEGSDELVCDFFKDRVDMRDFGNGREARVLLETAVVYAAKRTMSSGKAHFTDKEMRLLTIEDITFATQKMSGGFGSKARKERRIGFAC